MAVKKKTTKKKVVAKKTAKPKPASAKPKPKTTAKAPAKRNRISKPLFAVIKLSELTKLVKDNPDADIKVSYNFLLDERAKGQEDDMQKELGLKFD